MGIVEGVYRLLGMLAVVNERLGRHRLNALPANMLLTIGLGVLAAVSWNSVARMLAIRKAPDARGVNALITKQRFAQGYVAVTGRLMTNAPLPVEPGSDNAWVPLVDMSSGRAVLVQFRANDDFRALDGETTIEGTLRPLPSSVARRLRESNYVYAGFAIARSYMLIAGGRPGSLQGPLVTGTVFGLLALALAWLIVKRNVVFMPIDAALSGGFAGPIESAPGTVLVSGKLALDAKRRRFFTNMAAAVQQLQTGETAILSAIQTTRTMFGIKTEEHSGVWMLVMRPGSVTDAQSGYVFWGLKKMRATRFRYVNATTGASERAVVAYPAEG